MPRALNLRQIEIFKAVIEQGTVSRAAEIMWISQPAASKLLMNLEADTGLHLFQRQKGRLTPTDLGLRLYEEVDRIFGGIRQVETVIETLRREETGRLSIGLVPALADSFIQQTTMAFLERNPGVYCAIRPMSSHWTREAVRGRRMDLGFLSSPFSDPSMHEESLTAHALVCIMAPSHPLAAHRVIEPKLLEDVPFISFNPDSYLGQKAADMFERHGVRANVVLTADASPTMRSFVAAGMGVALVHPIFVAGMEDKLAVRPFVPDIPSEITVCMAEDGRNAALARDFITCAREQADRIVAQMEISE